MVAQGEADSGAGGALVATGGGRRAAAGSRRPDAPLLAQLLAARLDLPEARRRRRAAPEAAADAYALAVVRLGATLPPGRLSRIA